MRYEYFHSEEDVPPHFAEAYYIRPKLQASKSPSAAIETLKELLKRDLLEIVDILEEKLKKKKLPYRTDLLRQDLENAVVSQSLEVTNDE